MSALHEPAGWEQSSHSSSTINTPMSREIFRQVYVSLGLLEDQHPVLGVTSSISGEGRTTVAVGLAEALATDLGIRAVLVEADLERPVLAQRFGLAPTPGLADVLRAGGWLTEVMQRVSDGLFVVTAGTDQGDASRLMHQLPLLDPFHEHQVGSAVTILDLPPILNHSYGPLAARVTDALLLVVRAGVTPAELVREAIGRLEDRSPRGVVLNAAHSSIPRWWPDNGA
jgi:Mrp family chromosome partitioning ATPase